MEFFQKDTENLKNAKTTTFTTKFSGLVFSKILFLRITWCPCFEANLQIFQVVCYSQTRKQQLQRNFFFVKCFFDKKRKNFLLDKFIRFEAIVVWQRQFQLISLFTFKMWIYVFRGLNFTL